MYYAIKLRSSLVAEEKSRQRAEDLSQQVETLAASLERTRIAREIHDSLGDALTDLDIQLEVAQKLRSHNLEQSFQAVDTAKILARQCIEDVSQVLHQMRQSDFEVVGEARNGAEAIELAKTLQPDVILMDVRMPVCDGVQATHDDEYIVQSLQVGALGYLLKRTPSQDIGAAIRSVSQGYSQLGPTIALKVFSQLKPAVPSSNTYQELLTKREIEVLKLIGMGKNNQEIAQELFLSEGTVKNYVTQILAKLEMRDRIQAALWAQKNL